MREPLYSRIALVATGPLSGKSTLARELANKHGFVYAEHVRTLVEEFVEHYNLENQRRPITVSQVFSEKERWRVPLQDYSLEIGFSDPDFAGYWTETTLLKSGWLHDTSRPVVFDSFRGEVQADYMRKRRFLLVQLHIEEDERKSRAEAMGKDYAQVVRAMQTHPELETGIARPDVVLHSFLPVDFLVTLLLDQNAIDYLRVDGRARQQHGTWQRR